MNASTRTHSVKILIAEEKQSIAENITSILRKKEVREMAIARSGEAALELAQSIRPHLVLMDIRLQGKIDGVEAARRIQAQFPIPIIYTLTYADPRTLERAKQTKPYGYLLKPFKPNDLQLSVEIALQEYKTATSEFWLKRGENWAREGESRHALTSYNRAIQITANEPKAWIGKGKALIDLDRYKKALRCFERALLLDSGNQDARLFRGVTLDRLQYDRSPVAIG